MTDWGVFQKDSYVWDLISNAVFRYEALGKWPDHEGSVLVGKAIDGFIIW